MTYIKITNKMIEAGKTAFLAADNDAGLASAVESVLTAAFRAAEIRMDVAEDAPPAKVVVRLKDAGGDVEAGIVTVDGPSLHVLTTSPIERISVTTS